MKKTIWLKWLTKRFFAWTITNKDSQLKEIKTEYVVLSEEETETLVLEYINAVLEDWETKTFTFKWIWLEIWISKKKLK